MEKGRKRKKEKSDGSSRTKPNKETLNFFVLETKWNKNMFMREILQKLFSYHEMIYFVFLHRQPLEKNKFPVSVNL
jgi:hypothetical protein